MRKKILKVTKESKTGRNLEFQDTRNNLKMTNQNLINRLEKGNSVLIMVTIVLNMIKMEKNMLHQNQTEKKNNNLG